MIRGVQVLGVLVIAYLIYKTVQQWRKGDYGIKRMLLWLSLWIVVAFLFAFPSSMLFVIPLLTMQDTILAVLVVGLMVVYALVFETYQQVSRTERKLTELAQNLAIHDYVKKARGNIDDKDEEQ